MGDDFLVQADGCAVLRVLGEHQKLIPSTHAYRLHVPHRRRPEVRIPLADSRHGLHFGSFVVDIWFHATATVARVLADPDALGAMDVCFQLGFEVHDRTVIGTLTPGGARH